MSAMETETSNPFAGGRGVPDVFGGVGLFAIMDDGDVLCERCATNPDLPVHTDDGEGDGWGVMAWSHTGTLDLTEDELYLCAHCSRDLPTGLMPDQR